MIKRYRQGLVPGGSNQLAKEAEVTWKLVVAAYRANSLQEALQQASALVTRANQYIDQTSPFKIAKDPARASDLNSILRTLAEVCRALGILLWPVIPGAAEKLQRQLGFPIVNTSLAQPPPALAEGHPIGEIYPLFPRKDQE
jgi:methionyl-tRNA synthetase